MLGSVGRSDLHCLPAPLDFATGTQLQPSLSASLLLSASYNQSFRKLLPEGAYAGPGGPEGLEDAKVDCGRSYEGEEEKECLGQRPEVAFLVLEPSMRRHAKL